MNLCGRYERDERNASQHKCAAARSSNFERSSSGSRARTFIGRNLGSTDELIRPQRAWGGQGINRLAPAARGFLPASEILASASLLLRSIGELQRSLLLRSSPHGASRLPRAGLCWREDAAGNRLAGVGGEASKEKEKKEGGEEDDEWFERREGARLVRFKRVDDALSLSLRALDSIEIVSSRLGLCFYPTGPARTLERASCHPHDGATPGRDKVDGHVGRAG